eukprot:Nk52_evm1s2213 gene=Nk52_evmTU1s2213
MLRHYVSFNMKNWPDMLHHVQFAYNSSVQASTGRSPFYANYGFEPKSVLDVDAGINSRNDASEDFLNNVQS